MGTDLSIVIVNYNDKKVLPRCLAALEAARAELGFEVIVVDNGSTDGSVEDAERQHPSCRFVRAGKNLGFAAACNLGLGQAVGRHAMLLNPDTEVLQGALPRLVEALDSHPGWGVVGPRMLDAADRPYRAARRFPTPFYLFCECTRLIYLFPQTRLFASYFYGNCELERLDAVDQIEGSALVISGKARQTVGNLDERFFLFFEEVDWCRRVRDAGFEIHVVPSAQVRHFRATTMTRIYIASRIANAESSMQYFLKHYGWRGLASLRRWMVAALLIREATTRLMALIWRNELARIRADGARAERRVYRRGLRALA